MTTLELHEIVDEAWYNKLLDAEYDENSGVEEIEDNWETSSIRNKTFKVNVSDNDEPLYVRIIGYYNSWEGTDWNDIYFVVPYTVTEVRYAKES